MSSKLARSQSHVSKFKTTEIDLFYKNVYFLEESLLKTHYVGQCL